MIDLSRFVALEGIDNTGKTSLLPMISDALSSHIAVHVTKEFTSSIGPFLSSALSTGRLTALDKVLLFAADRQLRLSGGFAAALARPGLCVADRWTMSAAAYRSAEDGSLAAYVDSVNSVFPRPTLTVLIDLPAAVSLERGASINKNNYGERYLEAVRERYLDLGRATGALVLDGAIPFAELSRRVVAAIEAHVNTRA